MNGHYKTCVDIFQALSGQKLCFNSDLKAGAKRLEDYFLLVEKEDRNELWYKRAQYVVLIGELIEGKNISSQLEMAL